MFDPEEIPQVKKAIKDCAFLDRNLLDSLRKEVLEIKPNVRVIKPRPITTFSLVATDGTNNKLVYDPFYFQLIRVVDSNGRNLCLDTITPTTDADFLSKKQFDEKGNGKTALGVLMKDLGCETLNDLSPMIPTGKYMRDHPEKISKSWVLTYRDLCEWAVLYEKICYDGFANHTVVVRDGLLRSKIFKYYAKEERALFPVMMDKIKQAIDEAYTKKKIKIFFVGIAKHSQVLSRYSLAMQLEDVFPEGEPRYAKVPVNMEKKSLLYHEYLSKNGEEGEEIDKKIEINKYVLGSLYLARFGKKASNQIWPIDLLHYQAASDSEILGYLLMDTIDAFPIPHYPSCLQKALAHAEVVDFDLDILQDEVIKSIREILPSDKRKIMDHQTLLKDQTLNRQS